MSTDGPPGARRIRWIGEPGEQPPEPGEVLVYCDFTGHRPDWWHCVHHATEVRGRGPEHAWLTVTRHDVGPCYAIPDVIAEHTDQNGPWRYAEQRSCKR